MAMEIIMNMKTLQRIFDKLFRSGGHTIVHGKKAYQMFDNTHVCWLPVDVYKANAKEYDASPVGWYAFLRVG
jgi:hypothetical protein